MSLYTSYDKDCFLEEVSTKVIV